MSAGRASQARVDGLMERLSDRDIEIVLALYKVKLLTGHQLERLIFPHPSPSPNQGKVRRRVLGRLTGLGIVGTLERRIGGVRSGSNGLIYCLDRFGQRIAERSCQDNTITRTRPPYTPGLTFLNHTLAVSEAYVSLVELSRERPFRVRRFTTEPACWQADGNGGWLRPDALVTLENDAYVASWWLEIDQGSEHLGRIRTKLRAYERFARSGQSVSDGLLPQVLFATVDEARRAAIDQEIAREGSKTIQYEAVTQSKLAEHLYDQLTD